MAGPDLAIEDYSNATISGSARQAVEKRRKSSFAISAWALNDVRNLTDSAKPSTLGLLGRIVE